MNNKPPAVSSSLRPFFVLWTGQAISLLGSQLVQFALIWWLTESTGSAIVLTIASLVGLLPQVLLGPFVGVFVDRWNRHRTLFVADTAIMIATLLLAALFWLDIAQLWHVYFILFIRSLAGAFHWPAMTASTSLMVPEEHLTRIQGLNQTLNGGLNIASAPLGALLVSIMPLQSILAIDAATALFAIVPLFFIQVPQPETGTGDETAVSSFWQEMVAGLRYVRGWPALFILIAFAMISNFLLTPAFSLLPLLVTNYFEGGAYHLSALNVGFGVGIIGGGLLLSAWGGFKNRMLTTFSAVILFGLSLLLVSLTPSHLFWLAVGGMFLSGFMNPFVNGPIFAVIQSVVAPERQGRVFTLLTSFSAGMAPLGLLIAGPLADVLGVRSWFMLGAIALMLIGIVSFFVPQLINMEAEAHLYQGILDPAESTTS